MYYSLRSFWGRKIARNSRKEIGVSADNPTIDIRISFVQHSNGRLSSRNPSLIVTLFKQQGAYSILASNFTGERQYHINASNLACRTNWKVEPM